MNFTEKLYTKIESKDIDSDKIIFSDEAHFDLGGYVNKQNIRFWASENPFYTESVQAHPIRLTAWVAMSRHAVHVANFT